MNKIDEYLKKLGLSEIEAKIYLGLLSHGPSTVKELAEYTDLNRVTTHFQVNNLINKGLAVQLKKTARRKIAAESPDKLIYLIEQQEKEILQLKYGFPDFLKTVNNGIPHSTSKDEDIEVKYYKGKTGVQLIYDDVLNANELRSYVNALEIAKVFPNNMNNFIKIHNARRDMKIWEIMNQSEKVESYAKSMGNNRYYYKFIPPTLNLSVVDYLIYDGKVAIVNIRENPTGMIIINKDYYENAKAIFNFVWSMLPDHI